MCFQISYKLSTTDRRTDDNRAIGALRPYSYMLQRVKNRAGLYTYGFGSAISRDCEVFSHTQAVLRITGVYAYCDKTCFSLLQFSFFDRTCTCAGPRCLSVCLYCLFDALQPVTGLPGRQRLRLSSTSALAVPLTDLSTIGDRAFSDD